MEENPQTGGIDRAATEALDRAKELLALAQSGKTHAEISAAAQLVIDELAPFDEKNHAEMKAVAAKALMLKGIHLHLSGNVSEAEAVFRRALNIYRETGDKHGEAEALKNIGSTRGTVSDFAGMLENNQQSLLIYKELGDAIGQAGLYNNIALVFMEVSDHAKAVELYEQSLKLFREAGDIKGESFVIYNLGVCFLSARKYEEALPYFLQSIEIKNGYDEAGSRASRHGVAEAHRLLGNIPEALENAQIALEEYSSSAYKKGIAFTLNTLGLLHVEMNDLGLALDCYTKAEALYEELGNRHSLANLSINRGLALKKKQEFDEAKMCFLKAFDIAVSVGVKRGQMNAFRELAALAETRDEWRESAEYQKKYHDIEREIFNEETDARLQLYNVLYKVAEREKLAQLHKLMSQQLEQEVKRQRQELSAKANHIARQMELLERFRTGVKSAMRNAGTAEKAMKAVRIQLEDLHVSTINWDEFEIEFTAAHPHFKQRLIQEYPALTPMEVKICILLRVEMTSNAIANLLALALKTVENHRQNIRKKLNLHGKESLQSLWNLWE